MGAGGHRLEGPSKVVVHLAEPIEIAVEDVHLRVHSDGQGGCGHACHPGPQDHHLGAPDTGDAADQDAPSPPGSHQVVGTHQRGHPTRHLAHRREQGQGVVGQADRLVGDGGVARRHERLGTRQRCGQVQIGEEDLSLAQPEPGVLHGDGLLDPEDHVRLAPDVIGPLDDLGPGGHEICIGDGRPHPCALLDVDGVPRRGQFEYPGRGDGHPVLVRLDFLGDPDDHTGDLLIRRSRYRQRGAA